MAENLQVVDDQSDQDADEHGEDSESGPEPMITEPAKLMRIAVMLREVQEEARRAEPDEPGRGRLVQVHERALSELCGVVSSELQEELGQFTFDFNNDTPSQSEIMIAQAQLIGWLEGLFQGIQAAIYNQQSAAQKQLESMRQRGLPAGDTAQPGGQGRGDRSPGNYL